MAVLKLILYIRKKLKKFRGPQALIQGARGHNLKLTLDILECEEQKKVQVV